MRASHASLLVGLFSIALITLAHARPGDPPGSPEGDDDGDDAVSTSIDTNTEVSVQPVRPDHQPDSAEGSVSCGAANRGALSHGVRMPRSGTGFRTPDPWWERGHRYGTDELVGLIARAAALVERKHPGATLGVADLSAPRGGAIPGHRSHQSGRDADLIFYALDAQGNPLTPDRHMAYYSRSGRASHAKAPVYASEIPERYFDMARNWALVHALMNDSESPVEHIFVSNRVRSWLLRYAESAGASEDDIARARRLLKRPRSTGGHNDHMHIRVSCTAEDKAEGRCKDHVVKKSGRKKFYSRVRCPRPVEPTEPAAPAKTSKTSKSARPST